MISVIIPVYNVRDYLDRCIESVVSQTLKDIEILLVEGNSSDGSDIKCKEWTKKDSRIRLIKQLDKGLGSARNLGIKEAESEIIAFIDSDDWWDLTMLEKLYNEMIRTNADMVMCDRYNVFYNEDGSYLGKVYLKESAMEDEADSVTDNPNLIRTIEVSVNGKLYKKSIFTYFNIWQPNIFGEDRAIMYFLISKCNRIGKVHEALYYYHCERKGNSVSNAKTYATTAECMEYVRTLFVKDNSIDKYEYQLAWIENEIASIGLTGLKCPCPDSSFNSEIAKQEIYNFLSDYYPELCNTRFILGSYSLRKMTWLAFPQLTEKRRHYSYSGIISMFSEKLPLKDNIYAENRDRNQWLLDDFRKSFYHEFQPDQKDIILIDFLEERFDVARTETSYFTYSDIYKNAKNIYPPEFCVLPLGNKEVQNLWREKCLEFISFLKKKIAPERLILVRMKLTEKYGTYENRNYFDDIEKIKSINKILDQYYDFFIDHFEGIKVVDCCNGKYFYTETNFKFGCFPWHVNENFYIMQAELIRKCIIEKNNEHERGFEIQNE